MSAQQSTTCLWPLTGRLTDEISEALLRPRQPQERSDAVCAIVEEIYENIRWLHGSTQTDELASLHELLTAARAHSARMNPPDSRGHDVTLINFGSGRARPASPDPGSPGPAVA